MSHLAGVTLCARLQIEKDPYKFRELIEQINRLLTLHEKAHSQSKCPRRSAVFLDVLSK